MKIYISASALSIVGQDLLTTRLKWPSKTSKGRSELGQIGPGTPSDRKNISQPDAFALYCP